MSTSKHIDIICVVVSLFALLITGLFMNGKALGITPVVDGDAGNGQFTSNDLNAGWDSTGATKITLTGDGGSVEGSGAYIYNGDVHILYAGEYVLSGELNGGSVIVEADKNDKIWILLDGVSLHCDDNAAILIEQAGKVFLTLADGTENFISSGAEYAAEAISTGIDGVIYSRDDLTINGSGSLSVAAEYRHAIVCNDNLVIAGGNLEIAAVQDGIHANDSARIADAVITINAGDDGITVSNDDETGYIYIESGNISIPSCYEGIESIDITIAGGEIYIAPTDDGINAKGSGINSVIRITGGDITIINETGRDADGLDSNGDIYISGGNLFISVTSDGGSSAIDYGSENDGVCKISGGTVIAAGSSAMAEGFDSSSEQCFIMYNTSTAPAGTTVTLRNAEGNVLLSEVIPCSFSSVVMSTLELQIGETCTISVGDTEAEITVDNSSASGGFGMGGMFGGRMGMQQDGNWGGRFGERGGRTDRFVDETPDTGDTQRDDKRQQGIPDDDSGRGGIPDDDTGKDEMPEKQMPWNNGDFPQGGFEPDDFQGEEPSGENNPPDGFQMPGNEQNGMRGERRDEGQRMFGRQNQDWRQDGIAAETDALSPDTLILVGVSILLLLTGIVIAAKTKHLY